MDDLSLDYRATREAVRAAVSENTGRTRLARWWPFVRRNIGFLTSLMFLSIVVLIVFPGASFVSRYNPFDIHRFDRFQAPSMQYFLGTDELGRDILSRVIYGARVSLGVSLAAAALAGTLGVPLGLWAGYASGVADTLIMRVADVLLAFPGILLAMITVGFLGPSIFNVIIAIAIVNLARFERVARAAMLTQRSLEYVEAAIAAGASRIYVVLRSILPNTLGPVVVQMAIVIADAIVLEAALSFMGLGVQPPKPSWGLMLGTARAYLSQAPWYGVAPGVALLLVVLAFNTLADGLQKLLDPRRRAG